MDLRNRSSAGWRRTVLAIRAAGVILLGLAVPPIARVLVEIAIDPDVRRAARNVEGPAGILTQVATERFHVAGFSHWIGLHASTMLALSAGAYLLFRGSARLVKPFGREAARG